jgi:hypothetical protein
MPPTPNRPASARRRALELLAGCPDGVTQTTLVVAHGFELRLIRELTTLGFVAVTVERVMTAAQEMRVTRLRITHKGRQMLAEKR